MSDDFIKKLSALANESGLDIDKLTRAPSVVRHLIAVDKVNFNKKLNVDSDESRQRKKVPSQEKADALAPKDPQRVDELEKADASGRDVSSEQSGSHSKEILLEAVRGEYRYAMLGFILGLASIIGGVILGLHGVSGSTSWTAEAFGLKSELNDAAPGVVLFIVGVFMILLTRPRIKIKEMNG